MKLSGVTSKRKQVKWSEDEEIVKTRFWDLSKNLYAICSAKLGTECMIIAGSGSYMFEIIAKSMMPYEVKIIGHKEWEDFKGIETTKTKIYTGWYDQNPLLKWIDKGIITKDDYIMMLAKDKDWSKFKKHCHVIDIWANTEGDLGFKFEDCSHHHTIARMYMGVVDDEIEFTTTKDGCKCGFKGDAFKWRDKTK